MAKRKQPGKPLPAVPENYIDPAPTMQEVDQLVALWDLYAPARYKGLLSARHKGVLEQTKEIYKGKFLWDDKAKRYIEANTGRVISRMELHSAFSAFIESYSNR